MFLNSIFVLTTNTLPYSTVCQLADFEEALTSKCYPVIFFLGVKRNPNVNSIKNYKDSSDIFIMREFGLIASVSHMEKRGK